MPLNHGSMRRTLLMLLLFALLSVVSSSPIETLSKLATAPFISTSMPTASAVPTSTPTIDADSTTATSVPSSAGNKAETAPNTTCTTMPTPTCTPTPSCTPTATFSLTQNPLTLPVIIGLGVVGGLILIGAVAYFYFRRRSRSLSGSISDEQLLQTWATHGTGRLMIANQYGVTNPYFSGNPGEVPPGEFVVRETGTRKQMLDIWSKVHGTRTSRPGYRMPDGEDRRSRRGHTREDWEDRGWVALDIMAVG